MAANSPAVTSRSILNAVVHLPYLPDKMSKQAPCNMIAPTWVCVNNLGDAMVLIEEPQMSWSSELQLPKAWGHCGRPPDDSMNI